MSPRAYNDPILPNESLTSFAHLLLEGQSRFQLVDTATGKARDLPAELYEILNGVAAALLNNQAVSVVPTNLELTTNQAADLLNVSRTFLIRLIDSGKLAHRKVGTHRRVSLTDVLALRQNMSREATKGLDELAKIDAELGLDD
jgi:excisionase family DNA binding protein